MRYEAEAVEAFRRVYQGRPNFMTRNLESCFMVGPFAVEVSSGRGMEDQPIFGVTVIEVPDKPRDDLGMLCQSQEEVLVYVAGLETEDLTQTEGQ